MLVGFGVKAALVPVHTWLPDVYSRAPGGSSALLAGAITKLGLLALLRALAALAGISPTWGVLLLAAGVLNIAAGNLLALRQTQVSRLLACSSLAHVGYIVLGIGIGVHSGAIEAAQGGLFHFVTHGLMVALAFLATSALSTRLAPRPSDDDRRPLRITDLAGAARRQPVAALALTVGALGLAGLPPLAGFMSEWQIFAAGVATRDPLVTALVAFAALNVALSLAYYAPLVGALYRRRPSSTILASRPLALSAGAPLTVLALAVLVLGVWPGLLVGVTGPAGAALLAAFGV
jgi:formate hydrogenlyase subunit 3/multisubunit Na+/H+ antiporter MnhD subunit